MMDRQISDTDAAIRKARGLRARAILGRWRVLVDYMSPRLPKLFPGEF